MAELHPLICEILQGGGEVLLTITGNSMYPLLRHGRDKVCLASLPPEGLRKYDLPLFRRANGKYILHRVVASDAGGYTMMGDNQCIREYPESC
jgi:hypothetical protein